MTDRYSVVLERSDVMFGGCDEEWTATVTCEDDSVMDTHTAFGLSPEYALSNLAVYWAMKGPPKEEDTVFGMERKFTDEEMTAIAEGVAKGLKEAFAND